MASRIEDYAMIGDGRSGALVSAGGSIDWLCLPRFDSDACCAALLGTEANGFWRIAPCTPATQTRAYRGDTLVLDTEFEDDGSRVRLTDFMPVGTQAPGSRAPDRGPARRHASSLRPRAAVRLRPGDGHGSAGRTTSCWPSPAQTCWPCARPWRWSAATTAASAPNSPWTQARP